MSAPNTCTSDEITLPTSLRGSGGYAVFLYAWEVEIESIIDLVTSADDIKFALVKTDPGVTFPHLNDSQVIDIISYQFNITTEGATLLNNVPKKTFIRPIILAGEKIYCIADSTTLAAAITVNFRLHYQLKWVKAQVFNRSLLTNV